MGKLLTILGVKDQSNLPPDIFVAENLIVGMQFIYENSPESPKKATLAKTIAETIRLTLQQIKGLPLTPPEKPKEEPKTSVSRVLTLDEMEAMYGADWRNEIAGDDEANGLDWISPDMDKWFGFELTESMLESLNDGKNVCYLPQSTYAISKAMTTLNPKWHTEETQPSPQEQQEEVRFLTEDEFLGIYGSGWRVEMRRDMVNSGLIAQTWVDGMDENLGEPIKNKVNIEALKNNNEIAFGVFLYNKIMTTLNPQFKQDNTPQKDGLNFKVGDVFKHKDEPKHSPWMITKIDKTDGNVTVSWDGKETKYPLTDVILYVKDGIWVKVNEQDSDKVKVEDIPKLIPSLTFDGGTSLNYDGANYSWGGKTEDEYYEAYSRITGSEYKGNGWIAYMSTDGSNYDYWMIKQREQNYISIGVNIKSGYVDKIEIESINIAINNLKEEAKMIAETYNYDPSAEEKFTPQTQNYKVGDVFKTSGDEVWKITNITSSRLEYSREDGTNPQTTLSIETANSYFSTGSWKVISDTSDAKVGDWVWFENMLGEITMLNGDGTFDAKTAEKAKYTQVEFSYADRFATEREVKEAKENNDKRVEPKKKGERQSPTISANAVKEGTTMIGNDGNEWVSTKTKVGYNQWKKV